MITFDENLNEINVWSVGSYMIKAKETGALIVGPDFSVRVKSGEGDVDQDVKYFIFRHEGLTIMLFWLTESCAERIELQSPAAGKRVVALSGGVEGEANLLDVLHVLRLWRGFSDEVREQINLWIATAQSKVIPRQEGV